MSAVLCSKYSYLFIYFHLIQPISRAIIYKAYLDTDIKLRSDGDILLYPVLAPGLEHLEGCGSLDTCRKSSPQF